MVSRGEPAGNSMILQNVEQIKSKLGKLRFFQVAHIVAIPLFAWVAESGRRPGSDAWTAWHWVIAGVAAYAAVLGFLLRRRLIQRSEEALSNTLNPKALKQWEGGQFVGLSMAEGVVLCGVVVRMFLGGALWRALLFYAAGLFLLLLWTPRLSVKAASA